MKLTFSALVCVAAILGFAANSFADEASTSSASAPSSSILDNLYADYFATYHGPALGDFFSAYSVDNTGKKSPYSAQEFDSELTTAYLLDKEKGIGIGPDVPFYIFPTVGTTIQFGDVGIKFFDKKTIDSNGFRLATNFYVQAPTGVFDKPRGMHYALKTTPYFWYNLPDSRFTVGAWTEVKDYVGVFTGDHFKLYAEPYIAYRISKKFSVNLEYEMEWHNNAGDTGMRFNAYEKDLQPGFIWEISKKVIINPYIQLFTSNKVTADSMAVGATISARIF